MAKRPHTALDPANFTLSILILLLVGVAGGLGTEIVKGTAESPVWTAFVVILVLVAGLGILLSERIQRWVRRSRQFQRVGTTTRVTRARALVVFVSMKAGRASARDAAFYHGGEGVLQHLWLVTSTDAMAEAEWLRDEMRREFPGVKVYPTVCVSDVYSIVEAKEQVERIRKQLLRGGLAETDIVCDFTGMTKHMGAGMIFACAPREARLQFMHPRRFLADGRADPEAGPSEPVEVQIAYQIEEEGE
jgi:hypothetical protein